MKKTLLMVLLCLPVICLAGSAFAALGETEAQMAERYGPSVVPNFRGVERYPELGAKYHFREYLKLPYHIFAFFDESGLVQLERVEKVLASLDNKRNIAQEFNDQELQAFLDANSSYGGPFVEAKGVGNGKSYRGWYSHNVKAIAMLSLTEETFEGGEKDMIQTLTVETAEFEEWSCDSYSKRKKSGSQH